MNSGPIDVRNVETFCGLTLDEIFAKAKEEGIGGGSGGSELNPNPELPNKDSLTVGNTINWANQQWIVSHKTADECYLTLKGLSGSSSGDNLQDKCESFASKFTEEQKVCLKSVTAGNISGKVFVATKGQMEGGFSYFNNDSRRKLNVIYWTSTEYDGRNAWYVWSDGDLGYGSLNLSDIYKSSSCGFRPSICIDLTLYNT